MAALAHRDAVAIERASLALVETDRPLAELVISEQTDIAALAVELEDRASALMAQQQPVAGDLRLVMSTLQISTALARMGGLAQHVARTARMRAPQPAIVEEMREVFRLMGRTAVGMATELTAVITDRDAAGAAAIQAADGVMDELHRQLFTKALNASWPHGVEPAIDAALLGRFYERFADQAVTVARRVHYIITGTYPGPESVGIAPIER
jgi:phosphate transport system protein